MRLPKETWDKIVRALPRGYMDDLLTCTHVLTDVILKASEPNDNRQAPRRPTLLQVSRCTNGSLMISLTEYDRNFAPSSGLGNYSSTRVDCYNAEQLRVAVLNTWIVDLKFETMTLDLHNTLMEISPRWQLHSTLHGHGTRYPDKDTFLRFFEELVHGVGLIALKFDADLRFDNPSTAGLHIEPETFWNLPAIRNCDILRVDRLPPSSLALRLTSEQALRWVRIPPRYMYHKRLEIRQEALAEPVDFFLGQFQHDFMRVSDERPPVTFKITIVLASEFTLKGDIKHKGTNDVMQFYNDPKNKNQFIIHRFSLSATTPSTKSI